MKFNKHTLFQLAILVLAASVYRIFPNRPFGFAPQIAIALFSGSIFSNQKSIAFLMPLLSMLISDALYQLLYSYNLTTIPGFYKGQWSNYILFVGLTIVGFAVNHKKLTSIVGGIISAPTIYFLLSNSIVWLGNGGLKRGQTFSGYTQTLVDGIPFYMGSLAATAFFACVFFLVYNAINQKSKALA
jgi:hypothetical protein